MWRRSVGSDLVNGSKGSFLQHCVRESAVGGGDSRHAILRGVCPTVQMQSRRVEEESWLERRVQVSPQRRDTNDKS